MAYGLRSIMKKITITEKDDGIDVSVEGEMDVMEIHHMLRRTMHEIKIKHMKSKKEKK